eukprot:gene7871-16111_t
MEIVDASKIKGTRKNSNIKFTKRKKITKLNVPRKDLSNQLDVVAKKVFGIDDLDESAPSDDSNIWAKTDAVFRNAKSSYDAISQPFQSEPRVYKLRPPSSTVSNIANADDLGNEEVIPVPASDNVLENVGKLSEAAEASMEEEVRTFLDPFLLPAPWVRKKDYDGKFIFFNPITRQKKREQPVELWEQKLAMLSKLQINEEFSGWIYKEDEVERRRRARILLDFEKKLQSEIVRREQSPSDREQVEDVLFDIVEEVSRRQSREQRRLRAEQTRVTRHWWHPATIGYRMQRLGTFELNVAEGEDGRPLLTDHDYVRLLISPAGCLLPLEISGSVRARMRLPPSPPSLLGDNNNGVSTAATALTGGLLRLLRLPEDLSTSVSTFSLSGAEGKKKREEAQALRALLAKYDEEHGEEVEENDDEKQKKTGKDKGKDDKDDRNKNNNVNGMDGKNKTAGLQAGTGKKAMYHSHQRSSVKDHVSRNRLALTLPDGPPLDAVVMTLTVLLDPPPLFVKRPPTPEEIKDMKKKRALFNTHHETGPDTGKVHEGGGDTDVPTDNANVDAVPRSSRLQSNMDLNPNHNSSRHGLLQAIRDRTRWPPTMKMNTTPIQMMSKQINHNDAQHIPIPIPANIYDTAARTAFETDFLRELAEACCIPTDLITIQEVNISVSLSNNNTIDTNTHQSDRCHTKDEFSSSNKDVEIKSSSSTSTSQDYTLHGDDEITHIILHIYPLLFIPYPDNHKHNHNYNHGSHCIKPKELVFSTDSLKILLGSNHDDMTCSKSKPLVADKRTLYKCGKDICSLLYYTYSSNKEIKQTENTENITSTSTNKNNTSIRIQVHGAEDTSTSMLKMGMDKIIKEGSISNTNATTASTSTTSTSMCSHVESTFNSNSKDPTNELNIQYPIIATASKTTVSSVHTDSPDDAIDDDINVNNSKAYIKSNDTHNITNTVMINPPCEKFENSVGDVDVDDYDEEDAAGAVITKHLKYRNNQCQSSSDDGKSDMIMNNIEKEMITIDEKKNNEKNDGVERDKDCETDPSLSSLLSSVAPLLLEERITLRGTSLVIRGHYRFSSSSFSDDDLLGPTSCQCQIQCQCSCAHRNHYNHDENNNVEDDNNHENNSNKF